MAEDHRRVQRLRRLPREDGPRNSRRHPFPTHWVSQTGHTRLFYLAAHPERAETSGGHDVDSMEQRLADALIEAVNGDSPVPVSTGERCLLPNEPVDIPTWVSDLGEYEHIELRLPSNTVATNLANSKRAGKRKKRRGKRSEKSGKPRTALIVTISLQTLQAQVLGDAAIPLDHDTEFYPPNPGDPLGQTNIDDLSLKCCPHHQHRHKTGENRRRKPKPLQRPKPLQQP